jgi:multicomponent Na+:H+ antiporter subunit D
MALVSGMTAGALLRAGARVFLGLGQPSPPDPAGDEPADGSSDEASASGSVVVVGPAAAFVVAAIAWAHVPGLRPAMARAAAAFTDHRGYEAAVLGGSAPAAAVPAAHAPGATAWAYAALSLAVALGFAVVPLLRPVPVPAPVRVLRRLHDGHLGDYAAWAVAGCAVLLVAFDGLLR